jgi:hypothetical protein
MANKILLYMNMVMLLNEGKNEDSFNTKTFEKTTHHKALKVPTKKIESQKI